MFGLSARFDASSQEGTVLFGLFFANIAVPTLLCVAGIGIQWWRGRAAATKPVATDPLASEMPDPETLPESSSVETTDQDSAGSPSGTHHLATSQAIMLAALVSTAAIALAFCMRNGYVVWSEDSWMRIPLATAIVAALSLVPAGVVAWARYLLLIVASLIAAAIVFPQGEAWEFLLPKKPYWFAAIVTSVVLATYLAERRSNREQGVLLLAWIGCMAAAAFLTAQSFLKVTEPLLAVSSLFGCYGIATLCFRRPWGLAGLIPCSLFAASAAIANAQFNSYLGIGDSLSYFAMAGPLLVAAVSLPFCHPSASERWSRLSIAMTILSAIVVAVTLAILTHQLTGGTEEEW